MIIFSIDLETTGVDWDQDIILEFGAILEDTEKQLPFKDIPKFNCLLRHPKYVGSAYAIAMHGEIFSELAKPEGQSTEIIIPHYQLGKKFHEWICEVNKNNNNFIGFNPIEDEQIHINVAGKNFSTFDMRFLENLPGFKSHVWFNRRVIDPALLYFSGVYGDKEMPNLSECKKRAGIKNIEIAHRTIKDAWDIIQVLRGKMYPKISKNKKSNLKYEELPTWIQDELFKIHKHDKETEEIVYRENDIIPLIEKLLPELAMYKDGLKIK